MSQVHTRTCNSTVIEQVCIYIHVHAIISAKSQLESSTTPVYPPLQDTGYQYLTYYTYPIILFQNGKFNEAINTSIVTLMDDRCHSLDNKHTLKGNCLFQDWNRN